MSDASELPIPLTYKEVQAALKAWRNPSPHALLEQLLLVQEAREEGPSDGALPTQRLATNQVLLRALDWLQQDDPQADAILRRHYLDREIMQQIANERGADIHTANRQQKEAIQKLLTILTAQERKCRWDRLRDQEARLPHPTPETLFGVATARAAITQALVSSSAPWIVAICGLGGIGKTALADTVMRDVIRTFHFRRSLWTEVRPTSMSGLAPAPEQVTEQLITDLSHSLGDAPATAAYQAHWQHVQQRLKQWPTLVVIDNLEEPAEVNHLVEALAGLANPSRFLLTSRYPPADVRGVDVHQLDELDEASAFELVRHVARQTKQSALDKASPAELRPIFQLTGGNPLALRLVVGLALTMPLDAVLADLPQAKVDKTEAMYHRIYWRAWQALRPEARRLLKSMPMAGASGASFETIQAATGLDPTVLWGVIHDLVARSLLLVKGDAWRKRYAIHRLTESFLLTEIAQWPPSTPNSSS